ncbi:MAG: Fur family transcriptional regulator [Candidatus Poribacteria bacterium]
MMIKNKTNDHNNLSLFIKKCEENDLKITPQRIAIYRELVRSKDHPSADILHKKLIKKFPNMSLDTVNRTLLTFAKIGLTFIVENSGSPKRYDPNISNHHHFICLNCGTIVDFQNDLYDKIEIPDEIKEQTTIITRKIVILEGFCKKCKRNL